MNRNKQSFSIAIIAALATAVSSFSALSPTPPVFTGAKPTILPRIQPTIDTALHYRNFNDDYQDIIDIEDGELMSDSQYTEGGTTMSRKTKSKSRVAQRASPIISLHNIQDYQKHVLYQPDQMCIIRFSAPWCKVCRSTNVAYERMASKIMSASLNRINKNNNSDDGKRIKFFTVILDGEDDATDALKDMLQIKRVPQGVIHMPKQALFGQKVDMTRSNLSILRKHLERYLGDDIIDSTMALNRLKGEMW